MSTGWIKLHRQLLDWEWYDDINASRVFIHLMLTANHKDNKWRGIEIKRGSRLTSLDKLSKETNLSVSKIRTVIKKLISTNEIASKSHSQHTVFTMINYDSYQEDDKQISKRMANESQTNDKRMTTNKNVKNDNNVNKDTSSLKNDGFIFWWNTYPKKVAKPDALKAFKSVSKNMSDDSFRSFVDELCYDAPKRYAETEKQFIPAPAKYLRQELYKDDRD